MISLLTYFFVTYVYCREKISSNFVDINPYEFSLNKTSFGKIAHECTLQSCNSSREQLQENLKSELSLYRCSTEYNAPEVMTVLGKSDDWYVYIY